MTISSEQQIETRLSALPGKTALPFRQLLAKGQLNEETLSTILDAGDVATDPSKLLGFAIGYFHLRTSGIPVRDVIQMAKQQNRRINLAWAPKRWEEEHQRLSRAETLTRMAKENVHYDVSKFEKHLPERFDGYLIRTSRRLGMEGLRQRHCIASYHNQIQSGKTAIAAIFADGKRWTTQLLLTGNPEKPIAISQIKTRFNDLPPPKTRDQIYEMLGLDPFRQAMPQAARPQQECTYMTTLQTLLPILAGHGVRYVTVSFEGYGDSGSIEDISFRPQNDINWETEQVTYETSQRTFEDGNWITTREQTQSSIKEAIEDLTYEYLEETGVDWYNNDGGYGELSIDVHEQTVSMDINVRYTESTNEFNSERNIMTGDEI